MSEILLYVVAGLALGWLTLALGLALYRAVRRYWHTRRYGPPLDHGVLMVEYGRKMMAVLDRQALSELLTAEMPCALHVERAVLLLPEEHQLVAVQMDQDTAESDVRLPVSHAAVRWVASAGEAQRADRGRLHELIQQGRADLGWAQVWVPLMRGADLRGLWLLGERSVGERSRALQYAPDDLRCLTAIGRQAAVMLEATRFAEQERQTASELRRSTIRSSPRGRWSAVASRASCTTACCRICAP